MKRISLTSLLGCCFALVAFASQANAALVNVSTVPTNTVGSSGEFSGSASYDVLNAIDEDPATFFLSGSTTDPWYKVDFSEDTYEVEQVILWNRDHEGVSPRFHNVFVQLRDASNTVLWTSPMINPAATSATAVIPDADPGTAGNQWAGPFVINVPSFAGNGTVENVVVRRDGDASSALGLAELQVMVNVPEPSSLALLGLGFAAVVIGFFKKK